MPTDLSTHPRAVAPVEITEERWWHALEALPPMDWARVPGTNAETFTMPEPYDVSAEDGLTLVYWRYVRIGDRYWEVLALRSTPASELAAQCAALTPENTP